MENGKWNGKLDFPIWNPKSHFQISKSQFGSHFDPDSCAPNNSLTHMIFVWCCCFKLLMICRVSSSGSSDFNINKDLISFFPASWQSLKAKEIWNLSSSPDSKGCFRERKVREKNLLFCIFIYSIQTNFLFGKSATITLFLEFPYGKVTEKHCFLIFLPSLSLVCSVKGGSKLFPCMNDASLPCLSSIQAYTRIWCIASDPPIGNWKIPPLV